MSTEVTANVTGPTQVPPTGQRPAAKPMSTTEQNTFEGLFRRSLKVGEGPFKDALKAKGYDMDRPQLRYDTPVWRDCLDVAWQYALPHLTREDAHTELGAIALRGFVATIKGRILASTLPFLSAEAFVKSLPKFFTLTRTGVELFSVEEAPRRWRFTYNDPYPYPEFVHGIIMEGALKLRTPLTITIAERREDGFDLLITW